MGGLLLFDKNDPGTIVTTFAMAYKHTKQASKCCNPHPCRVQGGLMTLDSAYHTKQTSTRLNITISYSLFKIYNVHVMFTGPFIVTGIIKI